MPRVGYFIPFASLSSATTTAAVDLTSQQVSAKAGRDESSVQVDISGTATVDIEAKLNSSLGWAKIETGITSSKIVRIGTAYQIRLNCTSYTSGTVSGGVLIR